MTQEKLLKLALFGVSTQINNAYEKAEEFEYRTGRKSRAQEVRIKELWKQFDEIREMILEESKR